MTIFAHTTRPTWAVLCPYQDLSAGIARLGVGSLG